MKITLIRWIITLIFVYHSIYANANTDHIGVWNESQITGAISVDKKWNYYLEPQLYFLDNRYKFNQSNLYAGVFYKITPTLNAYFGIYGSHTLNDDGSTNNEFRLWQQLIWTMIRTPHFELSSRNFFEERKNSQSPIMATRFREKLKVLIPIPHLNKYSLIIAEEFFLQLNQPSWVSQRVFAENRVYLGMLLPIRKTTKLEVNYLNQIQYNTTNQMNHILRMAWYISI